MAVGSFTRRALLLGLGLQSISFFSVLAQENPSLRTFALQGGAEAAAEDDDFTCSKTKGCKIGCCGALFVHHGKRLIALLTSFVETQRLAKLFVDLVPTSAVRVVFPHATTKANVILDGEPSGPMLQHALSTCAAATLAFVARLQTFVMGLSHPRLNAIRGLRMRNS